MITRSSSKTEKMGSEVMDTLKSIQAQMAKMSDSLQSVHLEIADIKKEINVIKELKTSLEFTQANLVEVENNVASLQEISSKQDGRIESLAAKSDRNHKENQIVYDKLLRLDAYGRKENLKFAGVPENEHESNKQTLAKVRELFVNKFDMTESEANNIRFQRCHRMGPKFRNKTRDIIMRFAYFPDRENIWENRNKLQGSGIFLNEDFPPEIEKRRSKLYPVYKLSKSKQHKTKLVGDKLIIDGQTFYVDTLDKLPPQLHPKNLAEQQTDTAVLFYGCHSSLSNFYKSDFKVDGQVFNSCEQYYQYQKAKKVGKSELARQILEKDDPKDHFQLGKQIPKDEQLWDKEMSKSVMQTAV